MMKGEELWDDWPCSDAYLLGINYQKKYTESRSELMSASF